MKDGKRIRLITWNLFGENEGNVNEIIPNTVFSNPFKRRFLTADVVIPRIFAYSAGVNLNILSILTYISKRESSRNIWTDNSFLYT